MDIESTGGEGFELIYFYIDDVQLSRATCENEVVVLPPIDTFACDDQPLILSGLVDADRYEWSNGKFSEEIEARSVGVYIVSSFDGCTESRQAYRVVLDPCECHIDLPSIQLVGNRLKVRAGVDVENYEINLYNSIGQLIHRFRKEKLNEVVLPNLSATYFWQAELLCKGSSDVIYPKRLGGKLMVANP